MRDMTVVGANLLLLWSLSPLGGQAALRALQRGNRTSINTTTIRYMHTGSGSLRPVVHSGSFAPEVYQLFSSTIMASVDMKTAPRDNWGNVRVPRLEPLIESRNTSHGDRSGAEWVPVPDMMAMPEHHSSLVGLLFAGLPSACAGCVVNFTLEASYMSLASSPCTPWAIYSHTSGGWQKYFGQVWRKGTPGPATNSWLPFYDTSKHGRDQLDGSKLDYHFFLDTREPFLPVLSVDEIAGVEMFSSDTENSAGRTALNASDDDGGTDSSSSSSDKSNRNGRPRIVHFAGASKSWSSSVYVTSCAVTESHVEVNISCASGPRSCRATHVRRSRYDTRPAYITPLDAANTSMSLLRALQPAAPLHPGYKASFTEVALNDTRAPPLGHDPIDWAKVPPARLADRLALLLNTYYLLSSPQGAHLFLGGDDAYPQHNLNKFGYDFRVPMTGARARLIEQGKDPYLSRGRGMYRHPCAYFCSRTTDATETRTTEVYGYSRPWLVLLFLSAGTALLTGAAGTLIKRHTRTPDMLGYVASMTYNNPYFEPLKQEVDGDFGSSEGDSTGAAESHTASVNSGCGGLDEGQVSKGGNGLLDAMGRARALKNVRVVVGDVQGTEPVGRIAFTTGLDVQTLHKGRLYT